MSLRILARCMQNAMMDNLFSKRINKRISRHDTHTNYHIIILVQYYKGPGSL